MDNNELNVQLKAYKRRANLIFFLASFILSILITATFYFVFYHNYTVINDTILPVLFNLIEAVLLSIFLFEYVVQRHKVGTIVIGCTYFSFLPKRSILADFKAYIYFSTHFRTK